MFKAFTFLLSCIATVGFCFAELTQIKGNMSILPDDKAAKLADFAAANLMLAKEQPELIIVNKETTEKVVFLTFDDGPDSLVTPQILNILKEHRIKATFFVLGENVEKHPELVQRMPDEGHLVLSHGWNHPRYRFKGKDAILSDMQQGEAALTNLIGEHPAIMRTPFGYCTSETLACLEECNLKNCLWSIDTLDWAENATAEYIQRNVLDNIAPGDIVLMHTKPECQATADALPQIIASLQVQGYRFATIEESFVQ